MVMPSLLVEWTLSKAQALINGLITHADNTETLFEPLQHKRIRIMLEPMKIAIEIEFKGNVVVLSSETPRPVGLTLTGTPIQFLNTMTSHSVAGLHISGDGKIAQALQRALDGLNIDVEAFLESLVGGTLANTLMKGVKRAKVASSDIVSHTLNDIADYCHYEIRTTASQSDCDAFTKDVNALRYAVDHLAVKVAQLKRRIEERHV
ncbi:MAG: SCP2 domain-containing protein [Gammaproteobacteria bacterium]